MILLFHPFKPGLIPYCLCSPRVPEGHIANLLTAGTLPLVIYVCMSQAYRYNHRLEDGTVELRYRFCRGMKLIGLR
jgi:hypothetical protein